MDNIRINLPENVSMIISKLYKHGHTAFAVGGCVRDSLLGKTPNDWDITTSALPRESKKIFKDYKIFDTGLAHGTISIMIENKTYELTTYRLDGEYKDNRRPKEVLFVRDIIHDLSRRDFTMNAMAYNEKAGLIDTFHGLGDIKNNIIRTVNEPDLRFNEDALRILRAIRFASVMGFKIENATAKSIDKNKELLNLIAKERINAEFSNLLLGAHAHKAFDEFHEVFFVFLPKLEFLVNNKNVFDAFLKCLELSPQDLDIRLSILIYYISKSLKNKDCSPNLEEISSLILKNLRYSNEIIKNVSLINKYLGYDIPNSKIGIKALLKNIGIEAFKKTIKIKKIEHLALNQSDKLYKIEQIMNKLHDIILKNECFSLNNLEINGNDLVKIGIKPGIDIGRCLNMLLDMVICEEIENNHKKLKKFMENFH